MNRATSLKDTKTIGPLKLDLPPRGPCGWGLSALTAPLSFPSNLDFLNQTKMAGKLYLTFGINQNGHYSGDRKAGHVQIFYVWFLNGRNKAEL